MVKFLKKGIKEGSNYIPVRYSRGDLIGYPKDTITIYAKDYSKHLPQILRPKNESNGQEDYFETDRARIFPGTKFHKEIKKRLKWI